MATGISEKMGGHHIEDSLSPWTQTISPTLSHVCPYCNKSHNSRDSLMNHIQFHYGMVLLCSICSGCRSNQWRTVKGHIKKCAAAWPNVAGRDVVPGKPHWRKSDLPLMNHTQAPETETMYTLQVWPDPPNNEEATNQGQIFEHIQKEWESQVVDIREVAAAEAKGADKGDDVGVNKDDNKQVKPKPK